jgi:hypothetical protein
VVCQPGHGQVGIQRAAYNLDRDTTCSRYCVSSTFRPQYLVAAYAPAERGDRDEEDSAAPCTGPRSQITAVEGMKTLRQATKLWQEELDPEFGRSSKNIGASRPDNASRGPSPFMKRGRIYLHGGRCWEALHEVGGSSAASSGRRSRGQDASWPARSAELTEADAPNDDKIIRHSSATSVSPLTQRRAVPCPVACWPA